MDNALKTKLEAIIKEVDVLMVDPDIDIEYCIPEVSQTHSQCDITGTPYIIVKYSENKYVERKIRLTSRYIDNTPQEVAKLITFSIEQFKLQLDATAMGV